MAGDRYEQEPAARVTAVIDLFAGPGGWDVAASCLGIAPLGIEVDGSACATREAAGLRTLQADVAALDPQTVLYEIMDEDNLDGLIASPPCQSFSMAGKRGGEQDTKHVIACAHALAAAYDERAHHRAQCEDERSMLVTEPVRWVQHLRPRWVALEQVPPVLGLWSLFAQLFSSWGYRTWTGILSAERYGVPQTRKRAILLASLDFQPHPPEPTHQAYVPGEPQRHEETMFGEVLPWVSMAEALGWPVENVVRTGDNTMKHSRNAQDMVPYERSVGAPASTVDGAGTWKVGPPGSHVDPPQRWKLRANAQANAAERRHDEPAPTITGGHDTGERRWTMERPATTVAGDPRIFPPGHKINAEDVAVSIEEAAILQSFPPDYPWQGARTAQFQQIGNAVPPMLALAVLRQVARAGEITTDEERAA